MTHPRSPLRATLTTTAGAVSVLAGVAACGGHAAADPLSGVTARHIETEAIANLKTAPGFRIDGTAEENGTNVTLQLGYKPGTGCAGTIGQQGQGSLALIDISGTYWIRPDTKFWQSQDGGDGTMLAQALGGKYLKGTGDDSDLASMADVCQVGTLTSSIPSNLVKGTPVTVDGQRALPLTSPGGRGSLYVTDTESPRIIRVVTLAKGDEGHADITYGPVTLTPPPADETIDASALGS